MSDAPQDLKEQLRREVMARKGIVAGIQDRVMHDEALTRLWDVMDADHAAQLARLQKELDAVRLCFADASHASSATQVHVEMLQAQLAVALKACELIVAVRHCMMFRRIHDDTTAAEVLEKHGAKDVQLLAGMAQDEAEKALLMAPKKDGK